MATFEIVEGAPGQGKSLYTARQTSRLIKRNKKWYERQMKTHQMQLESWAKAAARLSEERRSAFFEANAQPVPPEKRKVVSNLKFSTAFEERHEGWILYWSDLSELIKLHHVDVIWDEIATELDARNWQNLTVEAKRFLSQYRKRGVDIYANTQDFSMIDARARLMITGVKNLSKIIGSPDISTTKPKPKRIWGIVFIKTITNWKETDPEKKKFDIFNWGFMLIEKDLVEIYDTTQDIKLGEQPPLRHEVRKCELHGESCTFVRVSHT